MGFQTDYEKKLDAQADWISGGVMILVYGFSIYGLIVAIGHLFGVSL